jgi:thymidine kinase
MSIELIIGPMFSGKSSELIRRIRQMKVINYKYIIIKPKIDFRYETNKIVSHNKESEDCIIIDDLNDISDNDIIDFNSIIIDEGQFLINLKKKVLYWCEILNKNIIIGGLDGDYKRNPLGEILDLIPFATTYTKLTALCKKCNNGTPAIFTHRIINNNNQILIGSDEYIPLCRVCYLKLNF